MAKPAARAPQAAASTPPVCQGRTKAGQPCRAIVPPGAGYCLVHDPERTAEARAAQSKGAAVGNRVRALKAQRESLDTPAALVGFVSGVIQDTIAGELPPEVARVALYGASIQRQLLEASDLERRLSELEARQGASAWRT